MSQNWRDINNGCINIVSKNQCTHYYYYDDYEWQVSCVDDFGNQYVGVFPPK